MNAASQPVEGLLLDTTSSMPPLGLNQPLLPAPAAEPNDVAANTESAEITTFAGPQDAAASVFPAVKEPALPEHLQHILFRLELRVPLQQFTLGSLQALTAGELLQTDHSSSRDLVLTAAGERLLLVELEAMEQQLTARVKRLI